MSYVHCHKCDWSQDDFWSDRYNPLRFLLVDEERLLHEDLDSKVPNLDMTWREYFMETVERARTKIQNMRYPIREKAKAAGWKCPVCDGKLCED